MGGARVWDELGFLEMTGWEIKHIRGLFGLGIGYINALPEEFEMYNQALHFAALSFVCYKCIALQVELKASSCAKSQYLG